MNYDEMISKLMSNLYLIKPCNDYIWVSEKLCGLQAQYFNNVMFSIMIRCGKGSTINWNSRLVKTWTLRGTLHAIPESDLPIYLALIKNNAYITKQGYDKDFLEQLSEDVLLNIQNGINSRTELKKVYKNTLNNEEKLNQLFSGWGGILTLLASQGRIAFSSVSNKDFIILPEKKLISKEEAIKILVNRYFTSYGPATYADAAKFLGLKQVEIKQVAEKLDKFQELIMNHNRYYYIKNDEKFQDIPEIVFLTGFDPLIIGYKDSSRILPEEYKRNIITLTGIIKPSVILNGKICGTWTIKSKKLYIELFKSQSTRIVKKISDRGKHIFDEIIQDVIIVRAS